MRRNVTGAVRSPEPDHSPSLHDVPMVEAASTPARAKAVTEGASPSSRDTRGRRRATRTVKVPSESGRQETRVARAPLATCCAASHPRDAPPVHPSRAAASAARSAVAAAECRAATTADRAKTARATASTAPAALAKTTLM